jgi:hypothetical protein
MAGSNAPFAMDLLRLKSTVVLQEGRPYHFVAHLLSCAGFILLFFLCIVLTFMKLSLQ